MKKKCITVLLLFSLFLSVARAQVITCAPAFPTSGDAVIITFYADRGNKGLKDYTGDVYAHTGVITDKSVAGYDWKYIVALWSVNLAKAKMTRVSANVYTLAISPSIRGYYGVPVSEVIKQMAFVFRSSDGAREGKTETGGDIFYNVSETPVFEVMLTAPDKYSSVVNEGAPVTINASASTADSLILLLNDTRLTKVNDVTAAYSLTASGTGLFKIVARAWKNLEPKEDSAFYYVMPPVVVEEVPAGLKPGVNITGDNSAAFLLYAPGKDNVFVTSDFNGWIFRDEGFMKQSPDGNWFWLAVDGLDPATEYAFQYVVDGTIRIPDPYTTKILDPSNDKYINSTTYPGLKAYPAGYAEGLVAVFMTQPVQYNWRNTSFAPPSKDDLVIYELLVRDFVAAHDFRTIRDSLDYFSRLGINAIEFMPVSEFEGNSSWGYNPSMYFAVDKYYGPAERFKELIDSCHSRGIAVIMDMVLNHAYGSNPMVRLYYNTSTYKVTPENPWFNVASPNPSYSWGYDFNHESAATQSFVDSVCSYWLTEFKIDGFRFDFTKGFTNTAGDGWAYDYPRISILKRIADRIWSYKPEAYIILEHFTDNNEEKELANYGFMLWGNSKNDYLEAAMGYTSDLSKASYLELGWSEPGLVSYMESHDEERMMYKNETYGNSGTGYNIKDFKTGLKRVKLAATFFFTIPGPKMIWQFEELGYDYTIGTGDAKLAEKPIRWDFYTNADRRNVYNNFQALIGLKKKYATFSSDDFTLTEEGKLKRLNIIHPDMDVVAVGNFNVSTAPIAGNFSRTGKWYEFFRGDSIEVTVASQQEAIILAPGEYRLYTSQRVSRPSFLLGINDLFLSDREEAAFDLYPNPFSNATVIRIDSNDGYRPFTVEVFSEDGGLVRVAHVPAGVAAFTWDGRNHSGAEVNSGVYFVRVKTGTGKTVRKVIKL